MYIYNKNQLQIEIWKMFNLISSKVPGNLVYRETFQSCEASNKIVQFQLSTYRLPYNGRLRQFFDQEIQS